MLYLCFLSSDRFFGLILFHSLIMNIFISNRFVSLEVYLSTIISLFIFHFILFLHLILYVTFCILKALSSFLANIALFLMPSPVLFSSSGPWRLSSYSSMEEENFCFSTSEWKAGYASHKQCGSCALWYLAVSFHISSVWFIWVYTLTQSLGCRRRAVCKGRGMHRELQLWGNPSRETFFFFFFFCFRTAVSCTHLSVGSFHTSHMVYLCLLFLFMIWPHTSNYKCLPPRSYRNLTCSWLLLMYSLSKSSGLWSQLLWMLPIPVAKGC